MRYKEGERHPLLKDVEYGVPPDPVRVNMRLVRPRVKDAMQLFVLLMGEYGFECAIVNDTPPDELKNKAYWEQGGKFYTWLWNNQKQSDLFLIPITHKKTGIYIGSVIIRSYRYMEIRVAFTGGDKTYIPLYEAAREKKVILDGKRTPYATLGKGATTKRTILFKFYKEDEQRMRELLNVMMIYVHNRIRQKEATLLTKLRWEERQNQRIKLWESSRNTRSLRERTHKVWKKAEDGSDLFMVFDYYKDEWVDYRESKDKH